MKDDSKVIKPKKDSFLIFKDFFLEDKGFEVLKTKKDKFLIFKDFFVEE